MCFLCRGRNMIQLVQSMHTKVEFVAFALMGFFIRSLLWFKPNIITAGSLGAQNVYESSYIAGSPASVFK